MNNMQGKRRRSGILVAYECKQIRSLIFEGRSNREIMELINLKPRTFYRYLEKIRKEDYFDLMTDRKGNLAVAVNLTRDRLCRILDRLKTIANNGTPDNPMGCTPRRNDSCIISSIDGVTSTFEIRGSRANYNSH